MGLYRLACSSPHYEDQTRIITKVYARGCIIHVSQFGECVGGFRALGTLGNVCFGVYVFEHYMVNSGRFTRVDFMVFMDKIYVGVNDR